MFKKNLFNTQTAEIKTSAGPVDIPAFYHDTSSVTAFFLCEYDKVLPKIKNTGLAPAKILNGKVLTAIGFYNYKDTSLGVYNEIILITAVYPDSSGQRSPSGFQFLKNAASKKLGFYHIDIALTENLPLAAGEEIWGLPKFIADVSFNCSNGRFEGKASTRNSGEMIAQFQCPYGKGLPAPFSDATFYSFHKNSVLKIIVNIDAIGRVTSGRNSELLIGNTDNRMTRHLRDLGLEGAKPLFVQTCKKLKFRLNEGVRIV